MVTRAPRPRLPRETSVAGVRVRVWASVRTRRPLPLLVVHDGHDYARRAALLDLLAEASVPLRAALLDTRERDEDYAASAEYSRRLVRRVLPELPAATTRVGVGASLGALALLHAHVVASGVFAALFLQSGSFFRRQTDPQERGFGRFARITRFVTRVEGARVVPIPVTMTCGAEEENLANNRLMRDTLSAKGFPVRFHELRGGHDWPSWRSGSEAYLLDLVREVVA